ncbi:hypothetical protein EU510_08385 [Pseudoalteromonas sp. FUC4]|uniref:DUF6988 family protein n=1 Tax=Pseudoalteromonas sp. FUC4 TaxID=2511201 RepID=UPI0011F264A7|nr:DUF5677 domain-containing protein [Pseudoalteromonas sp. FUC4]KAA1153798.1 hypothetical protein EU510_08385 [Pseudoalteromonas sp. FUC4]
MKSDTDEAYQLSIDINTIHEGLEIPSDDKIFIPSLFHSTVIEHHRSIILLIKRNLFSSACTLMRPLFEAYVKGLWFSHCAEEKDFNALRKDKFQKTFGAMIKDIDEKKGSKLSVPKGHYWNTLNSFTHSGAALLSRKYNEDSITNSHDDELLKNLLDFSSNYALLSGCEISMCSGNKVAIQASLDLAALKHGL